MTTSLPPVSAPASAADGVSPALYSRPWRGPAAGSQPVLELPPAAAPAAHPPSVQPDLRAYPPSHKVRRAQSRAAALSSVYMPVARAEVRELVRMRAPGASPRSLEELLPSPAEEDAHARPVSAAAGCQAETPRLASLDPRTVARVYEEIAAQGVSPRVALHAARARVAGMTKQARADYSETRKLRAMLAPRGIVNPVVRARMAAEAAAEAAEQELRQRNRPVSSRQALRPATAAEAIAPVSNDPLLPFGYQTVSPIAQGAFSTIVRARHAETREEVAVKTFLMRAKGGRRGGQDVAAVKTELECLQVLQPSGHAHIANLVETHEGPYEIHAILQYCGGGSLQRHLQSLGHGRALGLAAAAPVVEQIGAALAHMHGLGVAHRDVKPGNVVFAEASRASVRLVDFGFSAVFRQDGGTSRRLKTICGTPIYMAPELLRGGSYLGAPVDVWAFGCLAYELLHNRPAFRAESHAQLNVRILKGSHDKLAPTLPPKVRKLVGKLLAVDASERITAAAAAQLIRSAFQQDDEPVVEETPRVGSEI